MMRALLGLAVACALLLGWVLVVPEPARGHLFETHSVNEHDEIVWRTEMGEYGAALVKSARAWNAVDRRFGGRGVRLVRASETEHRPTVVFRSYRKCGSGVVARYLPRYPRRQVDLVLINECYVDTYSHFRKLCLFSHEFGHALHLDHNNFVGRSVMIGKIEQSRGWRPVRMLHDVRDYRRVWVR